MTARYAISDTLVLALRALRRIPRNPELLTSYTVQPIMFTLLFVYVFGGAIQTPGYDNYADFLIPGIIVQQMSFGGFATALGLVDDLKKGLVDRFRSLPMSRMAVLTGRTLSDIAMNALALVVMIIVGYIVGFSFCTSAPEVVGGIALCLLIGYAFSWVFASVGLLASTPEAANAFGFIAIFPLTFASSAFVPPESMPDWLQTFAADINPFSIMVDAVRALFVGGPAGNDVWGCGRLVRRPDRVLRPLRGVALPPRGRPVNEACRPVPFRLAPWGHRLRHFRSIGSSFPDLARRADLSAALGSRSSSASLSSGSGATYERGDSALRPRRPRRAVLRPRDRPGQVRRPPSRGRPGHCRGRRGHLSRRARHLHGRAEHGVLHRARADRCASSSSAPSSRGCSPAGRRSRRWSSRR